MKKTVGRFSAILGGSVSVLLMLLLLGCPNPTNPNGGDDGDGDGTVVYSGIEDWSTAAGHENGVDSSLLSIEGSDVVDETNGGEGSLLLNWQSTTDFRTVEFFAAMEARDLTGYDGIRLDIGLPVNINLLALVRIPDGGDTWRVFEGYIYSGDDDGETVLWSTHYLPFADANDPGWGDPIDPDTIEVWFAEQTETALQLNLNPVLNVGGGGAVDTNIPTYFDNIGFYSGSSEEVTAELILWDFEPEE